ncbi:hypothetical protein [Lacrimispora sp.]|uniref:hypothetical protein n=1 Tax=Lacrimispora sp. TaxID=2719234 RepID=UPI0028AD527F|nr:hypothetical protein [Lacrimispora sp.]
MKKGLQIVFALVMLLTVGYISAFAAPADSDRSTANISTVLTITDPETGQKWEWDLSGEDVTAIQSKGILRSGEATTEAVVSIDVGKYLAETFASNPNVSTTLEDDITIMTGLTYSMDAASNTVRIYNVFGATTPKGLYYAENRKVYWRNHGANVGGTFSPTSNSWNYSVDSTAGNYFSQLPPYSLLDCRVRISGMSNYRDISVKCTL